MGKVLKCGELVTGCNAVFRGETEEDVIRQATEHSKSAHNIPEIPKSLRKKLHRLVRDEKKAT
jgi:predicted small metal-binding protein